MKTKLFRRDFTMVVIGQIISLFGNNILRYALPLHLLNITNSAALYGLVLALSFIPMLILSPIGGIIADRVNKRNIMVFLDFLTAALVIIFTLFYKQLNLTALLIIMLMLLYGIQGAYQPAVQASIPSLVPEQNLMAGNAVINMVNSLSGILGPVLGGVVFGIFGLKPILVVSFICFVFSAVMEIFISIPFERRKDNKGIFQIASGDMKESYQFIKHERSEIANVAILLTLINMCFSALIMIGLPIVINTKLGFPQSIGNRLYGYAEGILAAGGLFGALISGSIGTKIKITSGANLIFACTATLLPIGVVLYMPVDSMVAYMVIVVSSFLMMAASTILSIQMITYVQKVTPPTLIGKVMALLTCLVMCGNPIGQVIYGGLFEQFSHNVYVIFMGAFLICMILGMLSRRTFSKLTTDFEAL